MNFKKHSDLNGLHAFLGGSKYHWINYTEEHLSLAYRKYQAVQKGVELHAFACNCIQLGQRLPKSKKSLNQFVNDAIGYRMTPELVLYYSENAFGTTDAICFREKLLRIHDYKSGVVRASMSQLEIYTGLFCLEYEIDPFDIKTELRIYQSDEIVVHFPLPEDIIRIMTKIVLFDKQIEKMKMEEENG